MLGYPDLPVWAIACRRSAPADSAWQRTIWLRRTYRRVVSGEAPKSLP